MFRIAHLCAAVGLFLAGFSVLAAENGSGVSTRVVEERTVVETKRTYETEQPKPPAQLKAAIFVENRAGRKFDDKVTVLEDMLASRLAGQGYSIFSREIIINALKTYANQDSVNVPVGARGNKALVDVKQSAATQEGSPTAGTVDQQVQSQAQVEVNVVTGSSETPGQKMDRILSDSTSAVRLAQNLGADYIIAPTIMSYGEEKRNYTGNGVAINNVIYTLRVGYRLAEGVQGAMVAGDTVAVTKTVRQSAGLKIDAGDLYNQLLDEAADRLAESLVRKQKTLPVVQASPGKVHVTFVCTIADFAKLPNAWLNEKNEVVLGSGSAEAQAMDVTVEINGMTVGSAPGTFEVPPGINKIRLSREGFKNYEKTINTYEGQKLVVAMQMSEAGFARWQQTVSFLSGLENNRKLTDAEVKVMEGYAQKLRQSGFKVDTTQAPQFNQYKTLY